MPAPIAAPAGLPVSPGEILPPEAIHILPEPGRYGLGPQIRGSRYGIAGGQLIRFDPETHEVLSILRRQTRLPD